MQGNISFNNEYSYSCSGQKQNKSVLLDYASSLESAFHYPANRKKNSLQNSGLSIATQNLRSVSPQLPKLTIRKELLGGTSFKQGGKPPPATNPYEEKEPSSGRHPKNYKRFITPEVYRNQLLAQMKEKKERVLKSRERKMHEEQKYEKERKQYYYFGREGGGAPIRDKFGHIIANRGLLLENSRSETQSGDYAEPNKGLDSNKGLKEKLEEEWRKQLQKQIDERNRRRKSEQEAVRRQLEQEAMKPRMNPTGSGSAKQIMGGIDPNRLQHSPLEKELKLIANEINQRQERFARQLETMKAEALRIKYTNIQPKGDSNKIRVYLRNKAKPSPLIKDSLDDVDEIPSASQFIALDRVKDEDKLSLRKDYYSNI